MGKNEGSGGPHGDFNSWIRDSSTSLGSFREMGKGCRKQAVVIVVMTVGALAAAGFGLVSLAHALS